MKGLPKSKSTILDRHFTRVHTALVALMEAQLSGNQQRIKSATTRLHNTYARAGHVIDQTFGL